MKLFIFTMLLTISVFGITMTPLYTTIENRKNIQTIFKIKNPTAEPVAVNVSILKLINTNSKKEQREETKQVQVYPTQFILNPKEIKSVRVRYMSKQLPENEEVYRVIAEELNIDVTDKVEEDTKGKVKAQIKMRFSYEGLLFVHKANAKAKLTIESLEKIDNGISLNIKNSGTASTIPTKKAYVYFATLKDGKEYALTPTDLKGAEFRRVLAGKTNTFHLKYIISVPVDKIESMRLEKK
jgi:P pilus assembly chaperone PapD